MILTYFLRTLLGELKSYVITTWHQAKRRYAIITAEPSLKNSFGNGAIINGEVFIGKNSFIGAGSTVYNTVLGASVRLWNNSKVENSVFKSFVTLGAGSQIQNSTIDSYSYLGQECFLYMTTVGKFCSIAQRMSSGRGNHTTNMLSTSPVFFLKDVVCGTTFAEQDAYEGHPQTLVGNDVWIGADVFLKSGVKIGNGAIVAAGAVVMHDVKPYSIVGGVPAREIRKRYSNDDISILQHLQWWNWPEAELREVVSLIQQGDVVALQQWKENRTAQH
jgi:chloramphenicol O-acetyltransferase type B